MSQCPETRPTPLKIQATMIDAIGGYNVDWSPFAAFTAYKKYVINGNRDEDDNLIDALDLVRLLRAYKPDTFMSDLLCSLPWWVRTGTDQQKVSLRMAAKFCHQLGLEDLRGFFMEESTKGRTKGPFKILWSYNVRIHYHFPSSMVNISDIMKIGTSQSVIDLGKALYRQQVLGVAHLQGVYVDYAYFERVCRELRHRNIWQIKVPNLVRQQNPTLERRFREVDSERYTILVTELVNPNMILLRTVDWSINSRMLQGLPQAWHQPYRTQDFVPLRDAQSLCSHEALIPLLAGLSDTDSETQCTLVENAESIKSTASYQKLEEEHLQETELDFHFGKRLIPLIPRKRTLAERSLDEHAIKHERSIPTASSVKAWLTDVEPP